MIYLLLVIGSYLLTLLVTSIARKQNMLDIPNERSSHAIPTPRGGGVAIVVSFYVGLLYTYGFGEMDKNLYVALWLGVPLAVVSLLDDIYTLSAKTRLIVQVIVALLSLWILLPTVTWWSLFGVLFVVWMINLFNFLDGIDGYAASEAIVVSLFAAIVFDEKIFLLLACAALGFLPHNWQKATIFMGDVGSTFLGFVLAIFVIYSSPEPNSLIIWFLLLGVFLFDATYTLAKRIINGEEITKAHKNHLFQRAVLSGNSHQRVTLIAQGMNLLIFILLYLLDPRYLYLTVLFYSALMFGISYLIEKKVPFQ